MRWERRRGSVNGPRPLQTFKPHQKPVYIPPDVAPSTSSARPDPARSEFRSNRSQRGMPVRSNIREHHARSAAKATAFAGTTALSAAPPLPARLRLAAPLGLPRFTPRALTTASASFVRREITSRSVCATSAMMRTARSFALGMSTATNCTSLWRTSSRKAAFRLRLSNFAITRSARDLRQVQRLQEFRPVGLVPSLDFTKPGEYIRTAGRREVLDDLALRLELKPDCPLPRRRDALVGHQPPAELCTDSLLSRHFPRDPPSSPPVHTCRTLKCRCVLLHGEQCSTVVLNRPGKPHLFVANQTPLSAICEHW
jgi:hypothetical protein